MDDMNLTAGLRYTLALPPSINHMYFTTKTGKRIMTDKAKAWMEESKWLIKEAVRGDRWEPPDDKKLVMSIWIFWPDNRRRDTNNLHKALCDAPEGIAYSDDKMVLTRDMDFSVDRQRPRVEVLIELHTSTPPPNA